jgi:hypothetical protein
MRIPLPPLSCILALSLFCGGCATLKKIRLPWSREKPAPQPTAVRPHYVGTITLVNEDARFVLIDAGNSSVPPAGTALKTMSGETETGVVMVGDVRKRPFAVADIVRGTPKKGDGVFQ